MSYLALARKWRPTQFSEVVGQAHVLTALENALEQNRLHHAYLFSGTRGVGKTTIGRLFAKSLNCEKGITAHPCGECSACREIDEGRFVDLLEIDAASRTKVEDTRELLDNVQYKPARGRFKVYLIDEVHMLSRNSFNALLKTLEEPPAYVKFLLATTDPQKLPVTILSRCLQFHLKPIGLEHIEQQLAFILQQETITFEPRALSLIAHAADGSMRDALSLTDQAIALGNGHVALEPVAHMLGTIDTDQALHLLQAISDKAMQSVMDCVEVLAGNGVEWDALLQSLCEQLHRIAMYQALPSSLDNTRPDAEKIVLLSQAFSPEDVQLYYQIALKGRADLPLSPNGRIGLEMVLLRMIAFRPVEHTPLSSVLPVNATTPVSHDHEFTPSASGQGSGIDRVKTQQPTSSSTVSTLAQPAAQPAPATPAPVKETPTPLESAQPMSEDGAKPSSSLGRLRHQLRSQRQAHESEGTASGKKSSRSVPDKNESVLNRWAQRTSSAVVTSSVTDEVTDEHEDDEEAIINEPYQWQPTMIYEELHPQPQPVRPKDIKQAFEHEKTPEMAEKLSQEVREQDEWAKVIHELHIPKLVEQLALNSAYYKSGHQVVLTLRPNQAHLNQEKARSELSSALAVVLQEAIELKINIGDAGQTPLELREALYQTKLTQAFDSLKQDPNVQFIERRFNAQLDLDSIRPI